MIDFRITYRDELGRMGYDIMPATSKGEALKAFTTKYPQSMRPVSLGTDWSKGSFKILDVFWQLPEVDNGLES